MLELPIASGRAHLIPAVALDDPNRLPNLRRHCGILGVCFRSRRMNAARDRTHLSPRRDSSDRSIALAVSRMGFIRFADRIDCPLDGIHPIARSHSPSPGMGFIRSGDGIDSPPAGMHPIGQSHSSDSRITCVRPRVAFTRAALRNRHDVCRMRPVSHRVTPLLAPLVLSALTFTTHFPLTRGTPSYTVANGTVYAVNRGVLYRSGDGGASFAERGSVAGAAAVVDPDGSLYDVAGLRRSDDRGATWKRFGSDTASGVRLAINPVNPAEIRLFGFCSSFHPERAGVFVSYDRGDTWQPETSDCTFDIAIDPMPPHAMYRSLLMNNEQKPKRR